MLDKLQKQKEHIKFYEISDMPLCEESFLLSDQWLDKIEHQWNEFLSPEYDYENWTHPNGLMDYIPCHISSVNASYLNITLLLDRNSRFHKVSTTLPISFFRTAFKVFNIKSRPYIIVDQNWFNNLRNRIYSAYVLIDFVGIRNMLNKYGEFPSNTLNSIKAIVDKFCNQNKDLTFLTCADNIIVKSGWEFVPENSKYQPEKLIITVNQLMSEIKKETKISSYAIMTQGANYVDEKNLSHSITPKNHFFMSSISVPFIEAFEMDSDIRKRIKNKEIEKMPFYIEQSFYISTKRRYYSSGEPTWFKEFEFESEKLKTRLAYSALTFENICDLIELNNDNT